MYMVYLSYMYGYNTACDRGLGWLIGCLEEQLVGTSKTCVRYKVPCRYRYTG